MEYVPFAMCKIFEVIKIGLHCKFYLPSKLIIIMFNIFNHSKNSLPLSIHLKYIQLFCFVTQSMGK